MYYLRLLKASDIYKEIEVFLDDQKEKTDDFEEPDNSIIQIIMNKSQNIPMPYLPSTLSNNYNNEI